MRTVSSYCRICEALCGTLVDVDDDEVVVRIKGDPEHPASRGYLCPKGAAMATLQNSPERIVAPRRRRGEEWTTVSWDEALDEIAERLQRIIDTHGPNSVAMYVGNPSAFSASHGTWAQGLIDAIGSRNFYSPGPQDQSSRQVANWFLYGTATVYPLPDIVHTDFLLVLGANPLVSHGSILTDPQIRDDLRDVVKRGGRLVVVDPLRTKTAETFEHVPVIPATDAWLLAAMLNVIFAEQLVDHDAVAKWTTGLDELEAAVAELTPERTAEITGVPADTVRELARAFASAPSAVAYARLGLGRTPMAATSLYLVDCLNVVTGNFDRRGGWIFGQSAVEHPWSDPAGRMGNADWGRFRTRIGGLKDVTRRMPWVLPEEIVTPGEGQVRALFVSAGNPVVTAPGGDTLERGLDELELLVCIDLFANETTQKADFILPATTFLERRDIPLLLMGTMLRPWVQATKAVVAPPPDVREEWWIFRELGRRLGMDATFTKSDPYSVADELLRRGVFADDLGIRDVESPLQHLEDTYPHGIQVRETLPVGLAESGVAHPDKKVHIGAAEILEPLHHLPEDGTATPDEMLLVGRRDLRSINSWMHAKPDRGPGLYVHPADAERLGMADGDTVRVTCEDKHVEVPIEITDKVMVGVVSYPHGWDERRTAGVNINRLLSSAVEHKDSVSGASHLDGVPVRVESCTTTHVELPTAAGRYEHDAARSR